MTAYSKRGSGNIFAHVLSNSSYWFIAAPACWTDCLEILYICCGTHTQSRVARPLFSLCHWAGRTTVTQKRKKKWSGHARLTHTHTYVQYCELRIRGHLSLWCHVKMSQWEGNLNGILHIWLVTLFESQNFYDYGCAIRYTPHDPLLSLLKSFARDALISYIDKFIHSFTLYISYPTSTTMTMLLEYLAVLISRQIFN